MAVPDKNSILRFRQLLEEHEVAPQILALVNELLGAKGLLLRAGTAVDATLIAAPSSTKNATGERDLQMKRRMKGNSGYLGMDAHNGAMRTGLVHTVPGTAGNGNDVIEGNTLLHSNETQAWVDAGYQGAGKRPDAKNSCAGTSPSVRCKRTLLDKTKLVEEPTGRLERIKARVRAKVGHPFHLIKPQFGHVKVRNRGLAKNTAQLHTLFAPSNYWMVRRTVM